MEPPAPPLDSIVTAVITLGGDVAYTVDADLKDLVWRRDFLPCLSMVNWTRREFTFHGPPVQVAANLLSFWTLCHGIDARQYPHTCCSPCKGASPAPPGS